MKMLLDSFIFSNFNYCTLVWHFCSASLSQQIEEIQERALRILHNDNYLTYSSLLLTAEWPTIEVRHLKGLEIEGFKTLKSLNPDFMYTYFKKGSHSGRGKNDLVFNRGKITTIDETSLRTLETNICNSLSENVKDLTFSKNLKYSLKHGTDLNADAISTNTSVIHISILELYSLTLICPSGNPMPNINKQSMKRKETVVS